MSAHAPDTQALAALQQEWLLLQKQHEQFELATLAIKLLALGVTALAPLLPAQLLAFLALLWLQDAISKTFQARLGERLLRVEAALRSGEGAAMQLHSEWQAARPGIAALLGAYLRSACRPTVAFPYPLLMLAALFL